jgi:hypothetical protein
LLLTFRCSLGVNWENIWKDQWQFGCSMAAASKHVAALRVYLPDLHFQIPTTLQNIAGRYFSRAGHRKVQAALIAEIARRFCHIYANVTCRLKQLPQTLIAAQNKNLRSRTPSRN